MFYLYHQMHSLSRVRILASLGKSQHLQQRRKKLLGFLFLKVSKMVLYIWHHLLPRSRILLQLKFLNALQGQSHEVHVTVV